MSFSPYRFYGQIESEKLSERRDGYNQEFYTLGSKNLNLNPYNIPSYTNKTYDKYVITSSITITSMKDACYCPFNGNIYFIDNNYLYVYSTSSDTIVATISTALTLAGGVSYAPSSNAVCFASGDGDQGRAYKINPATNTIVASATIERNPISCDYIPTSNYFFIGQRNYTWISWGNVIGATDWTSAGLASIKVYAQFIYNPVRDTMYTIPPTSNSFAEMTTSGSLISNVGPFGADLNKGVYCPTTEKLYIASSISGYPRILIMNIHNNSVVYTIGEGGGLTTPAYNPNVDRIIACDGSNCYGINPHTQTVVSTITGVGNPAYTIYSPINDRIYVGGINTLVSFKYW